MATYVIHKAQYERKYETWEIDTDALTEEQLRTLIDLPGDIETDDHEGDGEVESLLANIAPSKTAQGPADEPMIAYEIERAH